MVPFYRHWNLKSGILTQVKFVFYFRRRIDRSFPFHITMVDDGTQQHHEHLSRRPIQAILRLYLVTFLIRSVVKNIPWNLAVKKRAFQTRF
jgi:hypothetical protein